MATSVQEVGGIQTYPPKQVITDEARKEQSESEKKLWREVHHGVVIDNAARNVVNRLLREQRDDVDTWIELRNALARLFAKNQGSSKDLHDMHRDKIVSTYREKFDEAITWARFKDYHADHKTKTTASEPNEKTNVSHINQELYLKYFKGLNPLTVCYVVSSDAEGCVRAKRTHRVDAILALCKIAASQAMTEEQSYNVSNWIDNIGYYAEETHYMADNPGSHMRFDDN